MKIPGNILYIIKPKENEKLPPIFGEYILDPRYQLTGFVDACEYRQKMIACKDEIVVTDHGAGSKKMKTCKRKIADIVKNSSTHPAYGSVIQKIIDSFDTNSILELGTSVGIGTLFMSKTSNKARITTIEACSETQNYAKKSFLEMNLRNINFINDKFDHAIFQNTIYNDKFDFVYIDGNHKYESTIKYYNQISKNLCKNRYILIIDDINWSKEMYKAWKELIRTEKDILSINLYRMGIIFHGFEDLPKIKINAEIAQNNEV